MDNFVVLEKKKKYALLKNLRNGEYIVACGFDESKPDGDKWDMAVYYGNEIDDLSAAVESFRNRTEPKFITKIRLDDLVTKFIDCINGDEDIECVIDDMEDYEKEYFSNIKMEDDNNDIL